MGRGVLVDYHGWRTSQGEDFRAYDSFESIAIPLSDLKACLAAQGTEVKFGDILFIRSGQSPRSPLPSSSSLNCFARDRVRF